MPRITLLTLVLLVAGTSAGLSSMSSLCDGVPLLNAIPHNDAHVVLAREQWEISLIGKGR